MIDTTHIMGIGMTSQRTRDRLKQRLQEQGIQDMTVLDAIARMPRHLFVDEALASRAYEDSSLPIGHGQTISQPYIVARMTEAILRDGVPKKVLEVGTGSGYQAAILAKLVDTVYTVERIEALHERSRKVFRKLELRNIYPKLSDGSWGWATKGPFDAIVVTAAPEEVPETLFEQLADGGRLVIPVGGQYEAQYLRLFTRHGNEIEEEILDEVKFVPLVSG